MSYIARLQETYEPVLAGSQNVRHLVCQQKQNFKTLFQVSVDGVLSLNNHSLLQ